MVFTGGKVDEILSMLTGFVFRIIAHYVELVWVGVSSTVITLSIVDDFKQGIEEIYGDEQSCFPSLLREYAPQCPSLSGYCGQVLHKVQRAE